ncbi:hypothetical protein HDU97_010420 [Phlyctochytrium planicorne]|nr:hypothetical protein HDU97_010420 [Phlyctochytrium planicorne]
MILSLGVLLLAGVAGAVPITNGGKCWQSNGINSQITLATCTGSAAQDFTIQGTGAQLGLHIYSKSANGCVNMIGTTGTITITSSCTSSLKVSIQSRTSTFNNFHISQSNGQCIQNTSSKLVRGACNSGNTAQQFVLDLTTLNGSFGHVKIGNMCLQNNGVGALLTVDDCVGEAYQVFKAVKVGAGFSLQTADSECVSIFDSSTDVGAYIGIEDCNSSKGQTFFPTAKSMSNGGQVAIVSDLVSLCLTAYALSPGNAVQLGGDKLCLQTFSDSYVAFRPCYEGLEFQHWQYHYGFLINSAVGKRCLTAGDGNTYADVCGAGPEQLAIVAENGNLIFGNNHQCMGLDENVGESPVLMRDCSPLPAIQLSNRGLFIESISTSSCALQGSRKEWRKMTTAEKTAYINAVQKLRTTPSPAGRESLYFDLVAIHAAAAAYIHMTPLFLPWHRAFLRLYENSLRKIDPTVSLPYWDWSADAPNPLKNGINITQIIGSTTTSLGTRGTSTASYCIKDGFPSGWKAADGSCVTRSYNSDFSTPSQIDVAIVVQRDPTFASFAADIEYFHNYVHGQIGGDNDRLWYSWQQYHPTVSPQYSGNLVLPSGSTVTVKTSDWMPSFNLPVSTALTIGSNGQCSGYDTIDKTTISVARRGVVDIEERALKGILPWKDPSLANFVTTALQFARTKVGSGKHGTTPLPPMPGLPEWFVRRNMGARLCGKPSSETEDQANIENIRAIEARIDAHRGAFIDLLDKYLEENAGASYEDAFLYALSNIEVLEPVEPSYGLTKGSDINGATARNRNTASRRRRQPAKIEEEEEEVVVTVTVKEYVVVYERGDEDESNQDSLVAFNPLDAYKFNPNEVVLVEKRQAQSQAQSQTSAKLSTTRGIAKVTATATSKRQAVASANWLKPSQVASDVLLPAEVAPINVLGTSLPASNPSGSGKTEEKYDPTFLTVAIPLAIIGVALFLGFGYCLFKIAKNSIDLGSSDKKSRSDGGMEAGTADTKSKSLKKETDGGQSLRQAYMANSATSSNLPGSPIKGNKNQISIVTSDATPNDNDKYQIFSPNGRPVPKRSHSIGNPSSPRRMTLTAVQAAVIESQKSKSSKNGILGVLGGKKKEDIHQISSPTQVWKGNQLLAESGHLVDENGKKPKTIGKDSNEEGGGRDSTSSTSSSISTVSSGVPETEFRYEVCVPWIPQRFDELALAPGDSVIVYQIYEDGWCDGKHESSGEEGVFPVACLRGRTWSFFGVAGDNNHVDDDARTLAGAQQSTMGTQGNADEPIDLVNEPESYEEAAVPTNPPQVLHPTTTAVSPPTLPPSSH